MAEDNNNLADLSAFKHPVLKALEEPSEENVRSLSKGELVWVLAHETGFPQPDESPEAHNGTVPKPMLREAVRILMGISEQNRGYAADEETPDYEPEEVEGMTWEEIEATFDVEKEDYENKQAFVDSLF